MFDVRAAADLARHWIVEIANRINGEFFRIFVPELTVCLERVASVGLVVFIVYDLKVSLNPFVDLILNLLLFFRRKLAVKVKIETKTLSGNITTLLADIWID